MYLTLWLAFFAAGCLLSIGAYAGYARGMAAIMSMVVWLVLGTAVPDLFVVVETADTVNVGYDAVAYLCYTNAGVSALAFVIALYESLQEATQGA